MVKFAWSSLQGSCSGGEGEAFWDPVAGSLQARDDLCSRTIWGEQGSQR